MALSSTLSAYWLGPSPDPHGGNARTAFRLLPIVIASVGLLLSIVAWFTVAHQEGRESELQFSSRADNQALVLQTGVNGYIDDIDALRALLQSSDHGVSRGEFEGFAEQVLQGQSAILSVAWIPRVKREERTPHELETTRSGVSNYRILSIAPDGKSVISPERDEYFPVLYRLDKEHSQIPYVYGVDQADNGVRGQTLSKARDTNQLSVSADLKIRSGGGNRLGILVIAPVFRKGLPHATPEQRKENLMGFVRGVFETSTMVETIISKATTPTGLDLYLFDRTSDGAAQPLYIHASRKRTGAFKALSRETLESGLHKINEINIGDLRLDLIAAPIPGGPGTPQHGIAWAALLAGLALSAAVARYVWTLGRHTQRLESANAELDEALGALAASRDQLLTQNVRFDAALSNMVQGLIVFDSGEHVVVVNERYEEMYGLSSFLKPGMLFLDLLTEMAKSGTLDIEPAEYRMRCLARLATSTTSCVEESVCGRYILKTLNAMPGGGWIETHEDITERRQAQATISHMAMHDSLTGLPNRLFFRDAMGARLTVLGRGQKFAILCLDLDHFKSVNDTLGHPFGDELLRQVGQRLASCLRDGDIVARLGGDEFAIIQGSVCDPTDTISLMTRLIDVAKAPFDLSGHQVVIGLSIGVAFAPADADDADELLKNADMALYRAKADGRGTYRFFEAEMDARMQARRVLEIDMRKAIVNEEFELYYQPIVNLDTQIISSFEALIRWNHPERGLISPADFIPLAEETAMIIPIGEWVLRRACEEAVKWPPEVHVAVNLSPAQFQSTGLLITVLDALKQSGLKASRLELEITESVLLFNSESTLATLHALRALGARISMDDFGTGYSSLSYLRSFPFDKIKIDQSFVRDLAQNADSQAIVRAVAGLGSSLRMVTTGEGVETREELEYLKRQGCTEAQGYFFSRPTPAKNIAALLAKHARHISSVA
jgi:diguanylate cyclase (GGDEF)-like protein